MIVNLIFFKKILVASQPKLALSAEINPLLAQSSKGFTLIELLVVISILSVLAVSVLPSLGTYRNNQDVTQMAESMLTVLRAAQANAISGAKCGDLYNPQNKAASWNFVFDSNKYYYLPSCVDSSGNPLPSSQNLPEFDYYYNSDVFLSIGSYAYDVSGNKYSCNYGLEIKFANVGGQVNFANILDGTPGYIPGVCEDSVTPNLTKIQLIAQSSKSGTAVNIYIYKSGNISNQ